jgi:exopolyphosphatase/pppGpp-phosphohydrolase
MKQRKMVLAASAPVAEDFSPERGTAMERAAFARSSVSREPSASPDPIHQQLDRWVHKQLGVTAHERRVAQIAGAMFDLTRDLHELDARAKWMLTAGALVHDVGRGTDPEDHARIGAETLLNDPTLPLSPSDRRSLAYLTLHHRGAVPECGQDNILRNGDDCNAMLKLLGLLRASDTLDSRAIEPPRLLLARRGADLQICCYIREPSERAQKAFCRPKKYRLLEQTLECTVEVRVQAGDTQMLLA